MRSTLALLPLLLVPTLLFPKPAFAWGYHYLITDQLLKVETTGWADEAVPVEPIEAFLAAEAVPLQLLFREYYIQLTASGAARVAAQDFDPQAPTLEAFLRAARLNPTQTRIAYVDRLFPGEAAPAALVPLSDISPYLKEVEPFRYDFVSTVGGTHTVRRILSTYVDEPDWGLDHSLWAYPEYGYGEQPFGNPDGESSKAPFHMFFGNENGIVRKFAGEVTHDLVSARVDLARRLSELALKSGHPYWGWRFAAWGAHYVEDLSQPYHARAVPGKGLGYYLRYVISPRKEWLKDRTSQVEANRHFLYEDFVGLKLEAFYLAPDDVSRALVASLTNGVPTLPIHTPTALVAHIDGYAAEHARTIDRAVADAFPEKMTKDPDYVLEDDATYDVAKTMGAIVGEKGERLVTETAYDFAMTGAATRTWLKMVRDGE